LTLHIVVETNFDMTLTAIAAPSEGWKYTLVLTNSDAVLWFKRLTRVSKAESEGGFEDRTSEVVLLRMDAEQDKKSPGAW